MMTMQLEINEVNNTAGDLEEDDLGGQENEDETRQLLDNASNLLTVDKVREVSYDVLARTRVLFNIFASIYGVNNVHYDTLKQSLIVTTLGRKATVEILEDCTSVLVQSRPKDKMFEQQLNIFASRALSTFLPALNY